MYYSQTAMIISIVMGIVYSFIFIALMSKYAELIGWFGIVVILLGLLGGAGNCGYEFKVLNDEYAIDPNYTPE